MTIVRRETLRDRERHIHRQRQDSDTDTVHADTETDTDTVALNKSVSVIQNVNLLHRIAPDRVGVYALVSQTEDAKRSTLKERERYREQF